VENKWAKYVSIEKFDLFIQLDRLKKMTGNVSNCFIISINILIKSIEIILYRFWKNATFFLEIVSFCN